MRQLVQKLGRLFRSKSALGLDHQATLAPNDPQEPWWKTHDVVLGSTQTWPIGNIEIGLKHLDKEWQIAYWPNRRKSFVKSLNLGLPELLPQFPSKVIGLKSFSSNKLGTAISLMPILADKPLASRLNQPFYVPPNGEALIYVSSPLWVQVGSIMPMGLIEEIPTYPMSETWYGPNTIEGELCYAGFTFCTTRLEELPRKCDRIITPIRIHNNSRRTLLLDKAILPLPFMSIYVDEYHQLWTEQLTVKREGDNYPEVKLTRGAPKLIANARLLTPPRIEMTPGTGLKSLFNALIRK